MGALDRYTCEQVFHLLDDYVDRELAPDEITRVEEHLATCAQCARESRFEHSLLEGLKSKIRQIEVPPSAVERVEAILERNIATSGGDISDAGDPGVTEDGENPT